MTITITNEEFKILEKGLLELPAKESLSLILKLESQIKEKAPVKAVASKTEKVGE